MYIPQTEAMDYRQHRTELKGRAAAFKEGDSNPDAYKKPCYALLTNHQTGKASIQDWDWILLHRLRCSSDVAGPANYYRLQREAQPRAAQWHKHTRRAKLLLCTLRQTTLKHAWGAPAVPDDCLITLSVSKTFKQVNINKVAGPDGLPNHVLRACADQLASVFTDMFNLSLTESVIPTCFKQTTIVPVPKNTKVTCLNDYQPV